MQFLQFDSLKKISGLRHAITTRGGHRAGPYEALNLAYHVGDDAARVTENRKKIAQELGYDVASLVAAQQVHGSNAQIVTATQSGCGAFDWESALPHCDALIASESNVPLLIQVADCAPILLVDPKNHVLAVVHSGWRGAIERIASKTIEKMKQDATQIQAGIGPCLCSACFEIGPEVAEIVQEIAPQAIVRREEWQKPHLDLRMLIQCDLENNGFRSENIEIMPHCPRCQNDLFFSHRGQHGRAGRFGLIAWWDK